MRTKKRSLNLGDLPARWLVVPHANAAAFVDRLRLLPFERMTEDDEDRLVIEARNLMLGQRARPHREMEALLSTCEKL